MSQYESAHPREHAFDGDVDSYFWTNSGAKDGDHFTIILEQDMLVKEISIYVGKPLGIVC